MPAVCLALSGLLVAATPAPDDEPSFFETRILPVLEERCFDCHTRAGGMDGDLLLDSLQGMLTGGARGPAIVPGDPGASLLLRALRGEDVELSMPPDELLPKEVVVDFEAWIVQGAPWTTAGSDAAAWWSFQPMADPAPPPPVEHANRGGSVSAVDRFLEARLEEAGVATAPPADRRTRLRRVTFDLTGLPPTTEELEAFLSDEGPDAWERVVDRLLASPAYGEAWGRKWLDLARYADTAGDSSDYPIEDAWRYRNWVIDAFNDDLPYDEFLRLQIAGDLIELPEHERAGATVATGFLALARRYGVGKDQDRHLIVGDMIDTVGRAVLAETLGCARCHDHKVDPISTEEYYALYGIFNSTQVPFPGSENERKPDRLIAIRPDTARPSKGIQGESLSANVADPKSEVAAREAAHELEQVTEPTPAAANAYAVTEGKAGDARLQRGGKPHSKGPSVPRGFPAVLSLPAVMEDVPPIGDGSGRLALAAWLTHPENPRTARVFVNRIWQGHFRAGIVETPSDFGLHGAEPTHPELLDWLAQRFIEDGWSVKAMHRRLLLTEAYQRSSRATPQALGADPDNHRFGRQVRRRLSAEELRDSVLLLAGKLDRTPGRAHAFPERKKWNWTQHRPFRAEYETDKRSVYLMTQRLRRHPYLALFDGPDTNASVAVRGETTVPTQALWLRNSEWLHTQAAALGRRLREAAEQDGERVNAAMIEVYARPASADERSEFALWIQAEREAYTAAGADDPDAEAWSGFARVLLASNELSSYLD